MKLKGFPQTARHLIIPGHCDGKQPLFILPPVSWIMTDVAVLLMPPPQWYRIFTHRVYYTAGRNRSTILYWVGCKCKGFSRDC